MGDFCGGVGESIFSMDILIGEQTRTGPSLCFLDTFVGPLEALCALMIVASRIATVTNLPSTGGSIFSATSTGDKMQILCLAVLALIPLVNPKPSTLIPKS
jgi:hypothetical protein